MSLPIIAVLGATGAQGGSVVTAFTGPNPRYHVRALTSNVSSETAKRLDQHDNVTVTYVDIDSVDSLVSAFQDVHAIFANTVFDPQTFIAKGPAAARHLEEQHGLNIVQAASQIPSLRHLIWSTLPDGYRLSNKKFNIPHLQSKIAAEDFIHDTKNGLASKSTFLRVGMYGSNLSRPPYRPIYLDVAKKHVFVLPCPPDAPVPFIGDETINVGLIVDAILAQPEKTIGRYVLGASETLTCREWASAFNAALKSQGKYTDAGAVFIGCQLSEYEQIWGDVGTEIGSMMQYIGEYGDESFRGETGSEPILTVADLGLEGKLKSTENRLANMEWD